MESCLPSQTEEKDFDDLSEVHDSKYKEIISTFPRGNGWNKLHLYQHQGFWYYIWFMEGTLSAQEHFQAQSTDIFIASAPKSGTTWLKALCFSIATRTRFNGSTSPLFSKVPHACMPDLESVSFNRHPEVHLVATHIPYTCLPKSIVDVGCKIVYICRDPKDSFVSAWHFYSKLFILDGNEPVSLEEAFELFCQGIVSYGPYWDHHLGYWKASLERPDKILFLKYEELKKDTTFYVKKLAEFIGCPFTQEEEKNGVVQQIINMCSFENLSHLEVNKTGTHGPEKNEIPNHSFFRKGETGDWRNHLTAEMGARLDSIMEEKLKGSGLTMTSST